MRSRYVKSSFFKDESLSFCSAEARILFLGLSCLADRDGRLKDSSREIKAEVFPNDSWDVEVLLAELDTKGLITRYTVDNVHLVQVSKSTARFQKHARPHPGESSENYPPPPGQPPGPSREMPCNYTARCALPSSSLFSNISDPGSRVAAADNSNPSNATDDERRGFVSALVARGLSPSVARRLVETTDPALIREVQPYHAAQTSLRNPSGALRSMLENPEEWGFERTQDGWSAPVDAVAKRRVEDDAVRKARIAAERAEAARNKAETKAIGRRLGTTKPRKEGE